MSEYKNDPLWDLENRVKDLNDGIRAYQADITRLTRNFEADIKRTHESISEKEGAIVLYEAAIKKLKGEV
jgi:hypothetical protein